MQISVVYNLNSRNFLAMYCYEYLVTVDQEIEHVWAKKWTISTWIFVANRYTGLISVLQCFVPGPTFAVRDTLICQEFCHTPAQLNRGVALALLSLHG